MSTDERERAEFEKWCRESGFDAIHHRWQGWQARAALAATPTPAQAPAQPAAWQHYRQRDNIISAANKAIDQRLDRHQFADWNVPLYYAAAPPQAAAQPSPNLLLEWACSRWRDEVEHRPIINVHRRSLDDTWRQVIRYAGGNPDELLGPSHDALRAQYTTNEWLAMNGEAPQAAAQAPAITIPQRSLDPDLRQAMAREAWNLYETDAPAPAPAQPVAEITHVVGAGPTDVGIRWRGGFAQVGTLLFAAAPAQAQPDARIYWHAHQGWQVEWLTAPPNGGQSNYYRAAHSEPVAWADKIAFESAMAAGKGCDVWPSPGDYEARTGRALVALAIVTSP